MSDLPEKPPRRTGHISPTERASLIKQIAARSALGGSVPEMMEAFNLSRKAVVKLLQHPETQETVRKICEEAVQTAKNMFRARSEELAPKAYEAIKSLLESDNGRDKAEGVKLFFRTVGLDKLEESASTGTLIVQLPGGAEIREEKNIIEAEYDRIQDDES